MIIFMLDLFVTCLFIGLISEILKLSITVELEMSKPKIAMLWFHQ